jgi:hypothetical protein
LNSIKVVANEQSLNPVIRGQYLFDLGEKSGYQWMLTGISHFKEICGATEFQQVVIAGTQFIDQF